MRKEQRLQSPAALQAVFFLALLWGCAAVGPDYVPPDKDLPAGWHATMNDGLISAAADPQTLASWWATLDDPVLTTLIQRAVAGNIDLRTAHARVREARARRGVSQAGLFPTLDASGAYAKSRSDGDSGSSRETELYAVGMDAGWELDIFGGTRRAVEAAEADLAANREDLNYVLITLLAEVALNYIEMRTLQARIAVAEANVRSQQETHQLTQSRYDAGLTDELAVQSALYNLAGTRSQIPALQSALESSRNRLTVLLGQPPGRLQWELSEPGAIPVPPATVAVGVPADTVRQRPDVRRAERQLAAQTARIGVATAERYPQFRLLGTIGFDAPTLDDLLDGGSRAWRFGPRFSWRLFDGGAIRQTIEVRSALQEQALYHYKATILGALEEAETVLTAYVGEQSRREFLIQANAAAALAFQLARDQYEAGLVDFTPVLIAQRSLLALQDQLAQSEGTVTTNLVRLYKAMGGGWTAGTDAGTESLAPQ